MKLGKFLVFAFTVVGGSIVIVNNITQLIHELFNPTLNVPIVFALGIITLVSTAYTVHNWNGARQ